MSMEATSLATMTICVPFWSSFVSILGMRWCCSQQMVQASFTWDVELFRVFMQQWTLPQVGDCCLLPKNSVLCVFGRTNWLDCLTNPTALFKWGNRHLCIFDVVLNVQESPTSTQLESHNHFLTLWNHEWTIYTARSAYLLKISTNSWHWFHWFF